MTLNVCDISCHRAETGMVHENGKKIPGMNWFLPEAAPRKTGMVGNEEGGHTVDQPLQLVHVR